MEPRNFLPLFIQDVLKLLPSYSPEEQKTLRGIQDEIKQYTQSDIATEKDVATMRAEANALAAESARLYSVHNPSLPPIVPSYPCISRIFPPDFKPTFSDAETCLRELLALAQYVQEKKETVAQSKFAENATKLKRKQADKAQELSNLFKEEADELCKQEESLQKEINALQVQCKDIETKLNPESVVDPGPPVPMTMHMVSNFGGDQAYFPKPTGHSSAWYAEQSLREAMHGLKVQQDRVQKAKNKLPELQASKKEKEDRLRALKLRLEELNDKKRGAEGDVDSATLAKKARAEANSS